jgi:hypothetical protein
VGVSDGAFRRLDSEKLRHVIGPGDGEGVLAISETDAFEITPSDLAVRSLGVGLGGARPPWWVGGRAGARGDDTVLLWWSYLSGGPLVGVARRDEPVRTYEARHSLPVLSAVRDACTGRVAVSQHLPDCFGGDIGHTLTMFGATRERMWQRSSGAQPLAFSWDGTTLVVQDDGVVALDAATGRVMAKHKDGARWWAQVDPVLAISHDGEALTLWDAPALRPGRKIESGLPRFETDPTIPMLASSGSVVATAVSPDGARLAVLGSDRCLLYRIAH